MRDVSSEQEFEIDDEFLSYPRATRHQTVFEERTLLIIEDSNCPSSIPGPDPFFACMSSSADTVRIAEDMAKDDSMDRFEIIDISAFVP